ncbi:MAG: sugar phosphate isomerase/epimerase, partial [Ktedonobacteraceae bacterium]|nr:sugar phosphate isomerase/epimerase [Ktedonobacteraceae bacterium]
MNLKLSFSTLACPRWSVDQIMANASQLGYDGIEFRVVMNELDLWKLPAFHGSGLLETKQTLADLDLRLPCIGASAHFDSPDAQERRKNLDNAERIAELAVALGSPAIRVFGDRVQEGCSQEDTMQWITESLLTLKEKLDAANIAIWLETHGDFSTAQDVADILEKTKQGIGIIWDPANACEEFGESPGGGGIVFGSAIRHVHMKDFREKAEGGYEYTLMGEGEMPLDEVKAVLDQLNYQGFLSFEWEKHWRPE